MKIVLIVLSAWVLLGMSEMAFAQTARQVQQQDWVQDPAVHSVTVTPPGNQVQIQNQVQVQNQGKDTQLQVNIQEQTGLNQGVGEGLQNRNQNAVQNMSEVAKQVQQMLQVRTEGGIGEQVRQIAQEQNQAQTQIQTQLNKLDSKGQFARIMTGTDYSAVENIRAQLVQNQNRIQQREQLQPQLTNQADQEVVQATIEALVAQNNSLQERITAEEQTKSMFGWLIRWLNK